ncbi:MAG: polyketide synthase [Pirellulales bacterium]|nr:polyketide synthase [Pirellulales bacterium]
MDSSNDTRRIPLAIVGMGCRLPGADNLEQFWEMLVADRSAVDDLPSDRFDPELYYDPEKGSRGKSYTRRGAIPSSRRFDHDRCPIQPSLVRQADVTHLLMCQTAAEALRHADMDPFDLALRNTGVYVGHTIGSGLAGDHDCALAVEQATECLRQTEGFEELSPQEQQTIVATLIERVRNQLGRDDEPTDLASNMAAGIISKGFGLTGPFMAVNAACASSLEALLLAGRSLQRGKIDMAVVGGASVCGTDWLVLFSQAQSLSATDSRPFDRRADGLIVAEAYVALIVKTLARALADGDPIHAVIRGIGVSSDGRGRSLWAPRREGQVEAIRRAYESGVEMSEVQYIEAHATATQLGDATEIAALTEAFGGAFSPEKKIPITSVKASIGHALEAAGLVAMVKTVLCMQKGLILPAGNLEELNPNIDWAAAPVYVPREATPWLARPDEKPRRAGINAFGVGGLNVHVVLDDYVDAICLASPVAGVTGRSPGSRQVTEAKRSDVPHPHVAVADDAVAVVGVGCVFPDAHDVSRFAELIRSGRDPRRETPEGRHGVSSVLKPPGGVALGGYVRGFEYDWRRHKIPPKQIELADPLQFMVLDAADQAMRESGYARRPFDRTRTGVMVGSEFVGDFTFQLQLVLHLPPLCRLLGEVLRERGQTPERAAQIVASFSDAVHVRWPVLSDETGSFSASSLAGRIVKTWDLMGGAAAIDSGATSGAVALASAVDLLTSGDCDMMFWVAAQRNMTPAAFEKLSLAGQLSTGSAPRGPFDRDASGYVPGEGAGVLLLKRLGDAHRDGDPIRAVLRDVTLVHDEPAHAMGLSLQRALEHASRHVGDLSLAMTDATGLPNIADQIAQAVMDSQVGIESGEPLHLGSVVGQIGHTGGASVAASLLAAILALEDQMSPGIVGLQDPIVPLARNRTAIRCANQPEPMRRQSTGGGLAGAVLSEDKGLACSIIVELAK